jgi:hypothetical protein
MLFDIRPRRSSKAKVSCRARYLEVDVLEARRVPTVLVVNSLADILSPPAGTVTLRSAIESANQSAAMGVSNTIDLSVVGTYRITTLGTATDNSSGEFAITGAAGSSLTITNTSGGRVIVDGGGLNRVFDINPSGAPGAFQATFQSLTITDGVANGDGGGIRALGSADVELDSVDLDDNIASGGGGGVSVATGILYFFNSTVVGNDADHGGGGSTDASADTYAHNTFFQGNVAANSGGALDIGGTGEAYFDRDDFRANLAASGGAIADEAGTTTSMQLFACTLDQNRAIRGNGGAVYAPIAATSYLYIENCLLINNTANDASMGMGGAIDFSGGVLELTNSQLSGNSADAFGGAIDFDGTHLYAEEDTIDHSRTGGEGGALYFAGTATEALSPPASLLRDVTLAFNSAGGGGGGIYDAGTGDLSLVYDTINANDGGQGGGGGLDLASGGALFIGGTILAGNTVSVAGQGPDVLTGPSDQVTDLGGNLVGDSTDSSGFKPNVLIGTAGHKVDPELGPLLDNGMSVFYLRTYGIGSVGSFQDIQTEALATTSPAFGAGVLIDLGPFGAPTTDERGFLLSTTTPSIGAYQPQYASTATPAQIFVEDLYELLLNRRADPGGLAYWASQVAPSGYNGALIQRLETSEEYRTDQVQSFYAVDFNRLTNPGEVSAWVALLDSGALTLGQARADFLSSPEYISDYGGNVVTATEEVYEELLDRVPLTSEVDAWVRVLREGTPPNVVALDFVLSQEDETDLISADYQTILGRTASSSEVTFWFDAVSGSIDPETFLIEGILGAPEAFMLRTQGIA